MTGGHVAGSAGGHRPPVQAFRQAQGLRVPQAPTWLSHSGQELFKLIELFTELFLAFLNLAFPAFVPQYFVNNMNVCVESHDLNTSQSSQ